MKKNFIYLCMLACIMGFWSSCSKDDDNTNSDLVGTWTVKSDSPMDMTWEASSDATITMGSTTIPVSMLPSMISIVGNSTVKERLKDVTFTADGKIKATYYDDETGEWKTAEDYATYKTTSSSSLKLYIDADKAFADKDIDAATMVTLKLVFAAGIPVQYTLSDGSARFYLDTETIKAMKPYISIFGSFIKTDNASTNAMIQALLDEMPALLDKTTKIEMGLNFDKAN